MSDYGSLIISVQPPEELECFWVVRFEIMKGSGRYLAQNTCTKDVGIRIGPPGLNPGDRIPEPGPDGTIPGDFLRLEQAEFEIDYDPCDPVTHDLTVKIYVYRSRDNLAYRITTSHGTISGGAGPGGENIVPPVSETVDRVVQLSSGMDTSVAIQDQISGNVDLSWSGPVLNSTGDIINAPPITQSGSTLNFGDEKVLGTVQAKYQTTRTVHILTLPQRDPADTDGDDDSTTYAATVTAVWGNGQYTTLTVEPPEMTGSCIFEINPDKEYDEDQEDCYRLIKVVDPCTGEVLSERTESMECPEEEEPPPEE